ncbi:Uncharacterized protein QTN25_008123 [Entamoeba marina]
MDNVLTELEIATNEIQTLQNSIGEIQNDISVLLDSFQNASKNEINQDILTNSRSNFDNLSKAFEQVKHLESSTTNTLETTSSETHPHLSKTQQTLIGDISTIRTDIAKTAQSADFVNTIHQEIEELISLNQIRAYSAKGYLPKISQIAEEMNQQTIYMLSDIWSCGLIKYTEQFVMCFWNSNHSMALHVFPTHCLLYQKNQEYHYDLLKDGLFHVEEDRNMNWTTIKDLTTVTIDLGTVLTPSFKCRFSFLINSDNVLIRFDSGDIIAIDTLGECIFLNNKLITI